MMMREQRTLSRVLRFHGIGLHSGRIAGIKLLPVLRPNYGIWLRRVDIPHALPIEASWRNVVAAPLCTVLGDWDAIRRKNERQASQSPCEMLDAAIAKRANTVWTVEHLLAALHAVQLENLIVEVDGCEIPILDGSSSLFLQALVQNLRDIPFPSLSAGPVENKDFCPGPQERAKLRVQRSLKVQGRSGQWAELSPPPLAAQRELQIELVIDFSPPADSGSGTAAPAFEDSEQPFHAAQQHILVRDAHHVFAEELSAARTFCLESQLRGLWKQGLARGGSRRNALVFSQKRDDESGAVQLTLERHQAARFADEMVRHKALDVMGDLRLAGGILAATYRASQPSHALNLALVEKVFESGANYAVV
ncbi:UDP-3-O-acyl-N-acetylglucosamine deacetylase [Porphyridium purpureum]|uniref:UDP-3-O-acyl-N-acetylglucosamine deacetylase n=1 Tax=Porphyridium purpureum TaxID=35688 RepID=A0A5J4YHS9_PORPP|nr:UDP-3-O-acyl-N-acetylglucosamine deacetylase [Porphyridium purpureum]|eukprot:POR7685..scf269_36